MIVTSAKVTRRMQFELNFWMWIATFVCLAVGIGMCIGYLIWSKFVESMPEGSLILLLGVFPLMVGLGLLTVVSKNISQVKKSGIENRYAFSADKVLVQTTTKGKEGTPYSYPYAHFKKVEFRPHFIFLYPQKGGAFGVAKANLTDKEVSTLTDWLIPYTERAKEQQQARQYKTQKDKK